MPVAKKKINSPSHFPRRQMLMGPTIMSSSPLSDMQKKTKKTSMYVLLKYITNKGTRNICTIIGINL